MSHFVSRALVAASVASAMVFSAVPAMAAPTFAVCGVSIPKSSIPETKSGQISDAKTTVRLLVKKCDFSVDTYKGRARLSAFPKRGIRGNLLDAWYSKVSATELLAIVKNAGGTIR